MTVKTEKDFFIKFKFLFWFFPLLLVLLVKGIYLFNICNSPFRFYHMIRGLDMFTIHSMYKTANPSLYYLFLRLISALTPDKYFIESVIGIQLVLGIIAVLLVVFITLKLTENKYISCIAGSLYCLYAPVLMYEGFILKESFYLFSAILLLAACFYAVSRKFSIVSIFCLGIVLMIPGFIRGIGGVLGLIILLWLIYALTMYMFKSFNSLRAKIKFIVFRLTVLIMGILFINISVFYACGNHLPAILSLTGNLEYICGVGQQKNFKSINKPAKKLIENIQINKNKASKENKNSKLFIKFISESRIVLKSYLRNFLYTLRPYEIPNNLNYYFVRSNLKPLMYLIGPGLLFAFAFTGFLIFLCRWKQYIYPELLVVFTIPVFAACTFFIPIGRYRIVLTPVLVIFAAILVYGFFKLLSQKKWIKIISIVIVYGLIETTLSLSMEKSFLRASDYVTYGQALSRENSRDPRIFEKFEIAYRMRPDLTFTKTNLIIQSLKTGKYNYAERLLAVEYRKYPYDFNVAINYTAALLGNKDYDSAYEVLSKIQKPKNVYNLREFYFNWGEYYFLTGDYAAAKLNYEKLIELIEVLNNGMANFVKIRLKIINSKLH